MLLVLQDVKGPLKVHKVKKKKTGRISALKSRITLVSQINANLKKCVFSFDLKRLRSVVVRMSGGSLFHGLGDGRYLRVSPVWCGSKTWWAAVAQTEEPASRYRNVADSKVSLDQSGCHVEGSSSPSLHWTKQLDNYFWRRRRRTWH